MKNIMAIASGLASSLGLGDNARAALVSRGLAEIMRFGEAIGAHPLTLAGLAGMGDLVLTCYSTQSRNFRLGMALGRGLSLEEARKEIGQVAEGAYTVRAVTEAAASLSVDMPISGGSTACCMKALPRRKNWNGCSPGTQKRNTLPPYSGALQVARKRKWGIIRTGTVYQQTISEEE